MPAIYGTVCVVASVPLYYLGLKLMGITGVALAMSLSAAMQVILLYALWNRRSANAESRGVYRFFARVSAASIVLGVFLEWFRTTALAGLDRTSFSGCLMSAAVTGILFGVVLLGAGYGFKIPEVTGLLDRIVTRLRRS